MNLYPFFLKIIYSDKFEIYPNNKNYSFIKMNECYISLGGENGQENAMKRWKIDV